MKNIKKALSMLMIFTMLVSMSMMALAADGALSKEKLELLEQATARGKELGITGTADWNKYMAQAKQFLTKENLSPTQINQLKATVDETAKTMDAELTKSGAVSFQALLKNNKKVFDDVTAKVMTEVQQGLKSADIKASFDSKGSLNVVGPSGSTYKFSPDIAPAFMQGEIVTGVKALTPGIGLSNLDLTKYAAAWSKIDTDAKVADLIANAGKATQGVKLEILGKFDVVGTPGDLEFEIDSVSKGDTIYILHWKESASSWEVITPISVGDKYVKASFTSLSPVIFVKATNNAATAPDKKSPQTGCYF